MKQILPGSSQSADIPPCFGDGDKVCPLDAEGVMQPQSGCLPCSFLRDCLQRVLVQRGKLRIVDEHPSSKITGFFKRWSDLKLKKKE